MIKSQPSPEDPLIDMSPCPTAWCGWSLMLCLLIFTMLSSMAYSQKEDMPQMNCWMIIWPNSIFPSSSQCLCVLVPRPPVFWLFMALLSVAVWHEHICSTSFHWLYVAWRGRMVEEARVVPHVSNCTAFMLKAHYYRWFMCCCFCCAELRGCIIITICFMLDCSLKT